MGLNLGSLFGIGGVIAGGLIGSLFPGPGTAIGMAIGGMLGGTIGSLLFPQKMDANLPPPPRPRESRVQVSTYGAVMPLIRGSARLAGNIIYMQDVQYTKTTKKYRIDGVRFKDHTELYTSTIAVAFCRGEVTAIQRIWVNGAVFADWRSADDPAYPGDGGTATGNLDTTLAREDVDFSVHYGSESQTADATLVSILGAAETPAYRGVFYIVFIDFPVGEYSGVPTFEVEVIRSGVGEIYVGGTETVTSDYWTAPLDAGAYSTPPPRWDNLGVTLVLQDVGSWVSGYSPTRLRLNVTIIGAASATFRIRLIDSSSVSIYDNNLTVTSGVDFDITFTMSGGQEIDTLYFNQSSYDWYVTKIEFFTGDSYTAPYEALDTLVSEICEEAGLEAADIDVTDLAALQVQGFQVPRLMMARAALEPLMAAYSFDAIEVDWQLVFKLRGGSSAATIAAGELGAHPDGAGRPDPMLEVRTQEIELPTHLTLSYDSKARDYETATQRAVRVDKAVFTPQTVQIGLVMTEEQAKQAAEIILKQLWQGRHRYAFSVGPEYLKLAPGDVITVSGKEMRVVEMVDRDGIVEIAAESEPGGIYTSAAEADDLTIVPEDLTDAATVPELFAFDIPTIDEDWGAAGLWVALYDDTAGFLGGVIQKSTDGGATWEDAGLVGTTRAVLGDCDTTLADGIRGCLDYGASLTVDLADSAGTLASATDEELWEGANLCAVGSTAGGWEIIQFKTATLVSGNTYTLTGLLRGLYGTERYMATHAAGELFIVLEDAAGLDFVNAPTASIGTSYLYRVKNLSDTVGDAANYATGGLGLEPYPPQGIFHGYNASGDMVITWRRADRYFFADGDMPDGADIDMSETSESYQVLIYDSGDVLKRTLTSATQTATWTAAQIAADFPAGLAGAYLQIQQESALVGWGTAARYDF